MSSPSRPLSLPAQPALPLSALPPLLLTLLLALASLLTSCDQPSGTGGQAVRFDVVVRGVPQSPSQPLGQFTTATGWDVTLDAALIALGPLYLYENAPALLTLSPPPDPQGQTMLATLRALWLPQALAHPGQEHFSGGRVMGEALQQQVVNLLDPEGVTLSGVRGVGGTARALSVWLLPLKASAAGDRDALRGHTAYVIGTAQRDGQTVAFEGGLTLPEDEQQRLVAGIAASLSLADGARAVIELSPDAWLYDAHFDRLSDADPTSGRLLITPNTQPYNAWVIGARSARTFRVLQLTSP